MEVWATFCLCQERPCDHLCSQLHWGYERSIVCSFMLHGQLTSFLINQMHCLPNLSWLFKTIKTKRIILVFLVVFLYLSSRCPNNTFPLFLSFSLLFFSFISLPNSPPPHLSLHFSYFHFLSLSQLSFLPRDYSLRFLKVQPLCSTSGQLSPLSE